MRVRSYNSKIYLADNLFYLRTLNNYTQSYVAKFCNKKNTAISNWERGIREPNISDLGNLAILFNVSVEELLFSNLKKKIKN